MENKYCEVASQTQDFLFYLGFLCFSKVQILTYKRKLTIIRTVIVKVEPISSFTQDLSDLKQETGKLF